MKNVYLFLLVIIIATIPLFMQKEAEFGGADGQAEEAIVEIAPNYEQWFNALWEPPSGEIESLLFSVQTGVGAIIIGYVFGYGRARKKYSPHTENEIAHVTD